MQLFSDELAFILHMPLAVSVHHAAGQSETVWPAGALDDPVVELRRANRSGDRKSTRLNSSHGYISNAVFCLIQKTSAFRLCRRGELAAARPAVTRGQAPL